MKSYLPSQRDTKGLVAMKKKNICKKNNDKLRKWNQRNPAITERHKRLRLRQNVQVWDEKSERKSKR